MLRSIGRTLGVFGAFGGDEGKGKIVDVFAPFFDFAVRFSGGGNAGHTTYTEDGRKLVGHLIPSGLKHDSICVIARGVFFNAERFIAERNESLSILGGTGPPIWVDRACTLCTPYHLLVEAWCEETLDQHRIGTTGQGIGPMAAIRDLRVDLRVEDLGRPLSAVREKTERLFRIFEPVLRELQWRRSRLEAKYHIVVPTPDEVASSLLTMADEVLPHVKDTRGELHRLHESGSTILFEGAQALMLDMPWGTAPFISSGMSTALGVSQGCGLRNAPESVGLVTKVMPTRVGPGPLPSEFSTRTAAAAFPKTHPELFLDGPARTEALEFLRRRINLGLATGEEWSNYFQILLRELGATTGRGRSPGCLDLHWLEYARQINRPDFMALNHFDGLSGLVSVPIVTGYRLDGRTLPLGEIPSTFELERVEVIKEQWECWPEDIRGCREERELPVGARKFADRLQERTGIPLTLLGTGGHPHDLVVRGFTNRPQP